MQTVQTPPKRTDSTGTGPGDSGLHSIHLLFFALLRLNYSVSRLLVLALAQWIFLETVRKRCCLDLLVSRRRCSP